VTCAGLPGHTDRPDAVWEFWRGSPPGFLQSDEARIVSAGHASGLAVMTDRPPAHACRAPQKRPARSGGRRRDPGGIHPHIRQAVIDRSSDDLFWLRDTFDVVFLGIDYSLIRPVVGDDPLLHFARIEVICLVNNRRKAEVLTLAKRKATWRMLS
jgi:hypothetical protein